MKTIGLLIFHFILIIVRLSMPGGVRQIVAENFLVRQQLIWVRRKQKKSPPLKPWERLFLGFLSCPSSPKRLKQVAVIISPATIMKFHKALVKRKYKFLYSHKVRKKKKATPRKRK